MALSARLWQSAKVEAGRDDPEERHSRAGSLMTDAGGALEWG